MAKVNANSFITTQAYDAIGELLAIIDARGNRNSFSYDAVGRQVGALIRWEIASRINLMPRAARLCELTAVACERAILTMPRAAGRASNIRMEHESQTRTTPTVSEPFSATGPARTRRPTILSDVYHRC